jgi:hypothetical protein
MEQSACICHYAKLTQFEIQRKESILHCLTEYNNQENTTCILPAFEPELCTSNNEKRNFIFNIGLLYFTDVFRSFTQKVKLIFDMFFRHLNPQGVADFTEFALLSGT